MKSLLSVAERAGGDIRPIIEIFRLMGLSFVTACPVRDTLDSDPRLGWDKRVLTAVLFLMQETEVFLVDIYVDILWWMIKVLTSLSTPVLQYPCRQTPCTNTGAKCPPITKCDHQMAAVLQCCSAWREETMDWALLLLLSM